MDPFGAARLEQGLPADQRSHGTRACSGKTAPL
jgi:hypothetical protein